MTYFLLFALSLILSFFCTWCTKHFALRFDITDKPTEARKIHSKPIPLLGGIGIFVAFASMIGFIMLFPSARYIIVDKHVLVPHILGLLMGGLLLTIGGFLDDKYNLKPHYQIIWPILASLAVMASGIGIKILTNPFGGVIDLSHSMWSNVITFIWLLTAIYTTKFLDGLDGLVSGVTVIGCSIVALLSVLLFINIPTAHLATIIAGVYAGFLIWNFNPAKIFLGEAGSTLAGYLLGVLAIISGAKLATALLILGIPILDAIQVIFRRIFIDHTSPFKGDRKHIHFRLYDMGCTQRQAVLILYCIAAFFGLAALFLQSSQKVTALLVVFLLMILLSFTFKKNTADNR